MSYLKLVLLAILLSLVSGCSKHEDTNVTNVTPPNGISVIDDLFQIQLYSDDVINGTSQSTVSVGFQKKFIAIGISNTGITEDISTSVTWQSTDTAIAMVDEGITTGIKPGTTLLSASINGITSNTASLDVNSGVINRIEISPKHAVMGAHQATIEIGTNFEYTATGIFNTGLSTDVTDKVTWQVSDDDLATIDSGVLQGTKPGNIKVQAHYKGINSNQLTLSLVSGALLSIQIDKLSELKGISGNNMPINSTQRYRAIGHYDNGASTDITASVLWRSSNTEVATIVSPGKVFCKEEGTSDISVKYMGITSESISLNVVPNQLESIYITPPLSSAYLGKTYSLTAIGIYNDGVSADISEQVHWRSQATDIALVHQGELVGLNQGTTQVYAELAGVRSNDNAVTVSAVQLSKIQITPTDNSLFEGDRVNYLAIGYYSDDTLLDITNSVTWNSSNAATAVVHSGLLHANTKGSAQITASYDDVSSNKATLTVNTVQVKSIQLSSSADRIIQGKSLEFTAVATYEDNSTRDISHRVTWHKNNELLSAIVSGKSTAIAAGTTTVFASFDTVESNRVEVDSIIAHLTEIQVSPALLDVSVNQRVKFSALGYFDNGLVLDISDDVAWQSSDANTETVVNSQGVSVGEGTATVTASYDSTTSNEAVVHVNSAELVEIQISPPIHQLNKLNHLQYSAIGIYSNDTSFDLTGSVAWSSSQVDSVTIVDGLALGAAQGESEITATFNGVVSNTATLSVASPQLVAIQITPANSEVTVNYTKDFTAVGEYSNGSTKDITDRVDWHSDDVAISTVVAGKAVGVASGTTHLVASLQNISSNTASLLVNEAVLETIQMTPSQSEISPGQTVTFFATAIFSDNTTRNITDLVSLRSSNTDVVTVLNGVATAATIGETHISAMLNGVSSNIATVNVVDRKIINIQLTPVAATIHKNEMEEFKATGFYSDGSTVDITNKARWRSDDVNIVSVVQGRATGIALGSVQLSVELDGAMSNVAELTIDEVQLNAIQITPAITHMAVGYSQTYLATGEYNDNSTRNITAEVDWHTTDVDVSTIVDGVATGVNVGSNGIFATLGSLKSNDGKLMVTGVVLTEIQITPAISEVAQGRTTQYTAIGTYSDNSTKDITEQVFWNSSDTNIKTIINGQATAISTGEVEVFAVLSGVQSNRGKVTVTNPLLDYIQITPVNNDIHQGESQQLRAVGVYSDNTTADISEQVSWLSNHLEHVTVLNGIVTGVGQGEGSVVAKLHDVTSNLSTFRVNSAVLASIQITPARISVGAGLPVQLTATAEYTDGSTVDVTELAHWHTDNVAVDTIVKGLVVSVSPGEAHITVNVNNIESNTAVVTVNDAVLEEIQVTPGLSTTHVGGTVNFVAIGNYSNNVTTDITEHVSWHSSDTGVGTVIKGKGTGVSQGQVNITASLGAILSNNASLTVTAPLLVEIQLTPATSEIAKGLEQQYTATGLYSDNTTADITDEVFWLSSSPTIETVFQGRATAVAKGMSTITSNLDGIVSNQAVINVTDATLTGVQVTPAYREVPVGLSVQYKATAGYSDNTTVDVTETADWHTSNPENDTIVQGKATGLAKGSAQISASVGEVMSNSAELKVINTVLQSISILPTISDVKRGNTANFIALGTYGDGSSVNITDAVSWHSSDTRLGTVVDGIMTAIEVGEVDITVSFEGVTSEANTLDITAPALVNILISPFEHTMFIGATESYKAIGTYDNGTSNDITLQVDWHSSDTGIATEVDGKATAIAAGKSTITASLGTLTSNESILTVSEAVLERIVVSPSTLEVFVGTTQQFTAMGIYNNGESIDLTEEASWVGSDTNLGTIDKGGVYGSTAGTMSIVANHDGVTSDAVSGSVKSTNDKIVTDDLCSKGRWKSSPGGALYSCWVSKGNFTNLYDYTNSTHSSAYVTQLTGLIPGVTHTLSYDIFRTQDIGGVTTLTFLMDYKGSLEQVGQYRTAISSRPIRNSYTYSFKPTNTTADIEVRFRTVINKPDGGDDINISIKDISR